MQKPHPPLWTGGSAEAVLKRAGTLGRTGSISW